MYRKLFLRFVVFTGLALFMTVFGLGGQASVGAQEGKVTICHLPPGNPSNAQIITVSASAVRAHLAHGDTIGVCGENGGPFFGEGLFNL